jgi:hypothetical protein
MWHHESRVMFIIMARPTFIAKMDEVSTLACNGLLRDDVRDNSTI